MPPPQTTQLCDRFQAAGQSRGCEPPAALRAPRHAYGGPEPFGTGAGVMRWEREAGALLSDHLRVEREKEWKRLRHRLVLNGPGPQEEAALGPQRTQEINLMRLQVRYKKFWDLMNERDRPWHFDVVVHLCTALSPYTCGRYFSVTAGTMQGILAQRAKAERAVRDLREDCRTLQRRLAGMTIRMARSGRPVSGEQLYQMERLEVQVSAGSGIAEWQLRRMQDIARATYQDTDYADHVAALLPLLQETKLLSDVARREMLPFVRALRDELEAFQDDLDERRLPRDELLRFLDELRDRELPPADRGRWPPLRPDEDVGWRYPPLEYWRASEDARRGSSGGGGSGAGRDAVGIGFGGRDGAGPWSDSDDGSGGGGSGGDSAWMWG
ncbi:hypothetical protein PLESTF_001770300 [Pleodorina starrii]|nr:hypothetical protein PLESTF_001770300 [Pleodorina starrii]